MGVLDGVTPSRQRPFFILLDIAGAIGYTVGTSNREGSGKANHRVPAS